MLTLDYDGDDLPLEDDEEVKSEPEETSAERIKLNSRKRKTTGLKILAPNKLLTGKAGKLGTVFSGNRKNIFFISITISPKKFTTI